MAWNNLKRNARKTITLLFAVVLASFLIFTIFTIGNSYFKLQKIQNIRMSGAEFDAILYGVTDEQRQLCEENPNITLTGTAGSCGWVEKTDKDSTPNVGLIWADDAYWTQMMAPVREKLEGTYPTAFNEIMVTKKALKECGYETLKVVIPFRCPMELMMAFRQEILKLAEFGMDTDQRKYFMYQKNSMISRAGNSHRLLLAVILLISSKNL